MRAWMLAIWMGLGWGVQARAHTLEVTTARVTLRDGQIAVTAQVDVLELMQALRRADDVPLGLLAVIDPPVFDALAKEAWGILQKETTLHVDGTSVVTAGWQFPDVEPLRGEAQRRWMAQAVGDHVHPTFSPISFEARVVRPPTTVEVALPHAVGPVLMTFVQPVGQLVEAGRSLTVRVPDHALILAPASAPRGPVGAP